MTPMEKSLKQREHDRDYARDAQETEQPLGTLGKPPATIEEANARAEKMLEVINDCIAHMNLPLGMTLGTLRLVEMNMTMYLAERAAQGDNPEDWKG